MTSRSCRFIPLLLTFALLGAIRGVLQALAPRGDHEDRYMYVPVDVRDDADTLHNPLEVSEDDADAMPNAKKDFNQSYWSDLSDKALEEATMLGFTEELWDNDSRIPIYSTPYQDLGVKEKEAATHLGLESYFDKFRSTATVGDCTRPWSTAGETYTFPITLQNQKIGSVGPICCMADDLGVTCDLIVPSSGLDCPNINGPTVLRVNSTYHLFAGGHGSGGTIRLFVSSSLSGGGTWVEETGKLDIPSFPDCHEGLYSPDIVRHGGKYIMHAHVHGCDSVRPKELQMTPQPTVTMVSDDLYRWKMHTKADSYASTDLFYARLFTYRGVLYGIAKSQEDTVGSMVLFRSESPRGPYTRIRTLAKGSRHTAVHLQGDLLFVFFTLIGDMPERIILGYIDLAPEDERQWSLIPGPVILSPSDIYGGDVQLQPSKSGAAPCEPVGELRDPYFVPEKEKKQKQRVRHGSYDLLRGTLFYTLRGEQAIGAARIHVDLKLYRNSVKFRDHAQIDPIVFNSSSLANQPNALARPLLITGVGRSGTTFICKYLNELGWNISHDNNDDCGEFGGKFGAASWYHAFWKTQHRSEQIKVEKVVHLVRNPLAVVKSRLARSKIQKKRNFVWETIGNTEDTAFRYVREANFATLALRHWINRNSFVSQHAQWRIAIEDLSKEPLQTWLLCLNVGRVECPDLETVRDVLSKMSGNINNNGVVGGHDVNDVIWWERLAETSNDDVRIALKMAEEFGYTLHHRLVTKFQLEGVRYACGFANEVAARLGAEEPREWACHLKENIERSPVSVNDPHIDHKTRQFLDVKQLIRGDDVPSDEADSPNTTRLGTITAATQITVSPTKLQRLVDLAIRWADGYVSAAIYVHASSSAYEDVKSFLSMHSDQFKNTIIHLVTDTRSKEDIVSYPINILRNIAMEHAPTDLVLLLDVDFIPSTNAHAQLAKLYPSVTSTGESTALIIPAFERKLSKGENETSPAESFNLPTNKADLIHARDMHPGKYEHFQPHYYRGHGRTNFEKWYSATKPYQVKYLLRFEPYFVISKGKRPPLFWEFFIGFGFNKWSRVAELSFAGYIFTVAPDCFLVHIYDYDRSNPRWPKMVDEFTSHFDKYLYQTYGKSIGNSLWDFSTYYWEQLPEEMKAAGALLGFDKKSWDEDEHIPAYDKRSFDQDEIEAIELLGLQKSFRHFGQ